MKFHDLSMHGIFLGQILGFSGEWEPCKCLQTNHEQFLLAVLEILCLQIFTSGGG